MYEKLMEHVQLLPSSYEKTLIIRNYCEFLLEQDKNSILANSK